MVDFPKISIVTPSFNQGKYIEKTILSVIEQGYPNLEYIIIDGGSTDESVEIIKKYEKYLAYWVSEPDRGQSHAINKGFEKAAGEIFGWLNSDDWYHPGALKTVAEAFAANPGAGAVVGGGDYVDDNGNVICMISPVKVDLNTLYAWFDNNFWQPSCFYTRDAWQKSGPLDESLHLCMDYELWIKIAKKFSFITIPQNLSATLLHSHSKTFQSSHDADLLTLKLVMHHGGPEAFNKIMDSYSKRLANFDHAALERDMAAQQREKALQKELYCTKRVIELLHKHVAELNDQNQNLKKSLSWKVTAPLRRTLDMMKGVKPVKPLVKNSLLLDLCDSAADRKSKIEFLTCEQPLVSIIIPVHNHFSLTWTCLVSILKNTKSISYEVIIADDGSNDKTCSLKKNASNLRIVRNETPVGFLKNCNSAAGNAKGEFILFLNNDVVVQHGWLDSLVEVMLDDPNVGIVGSKLVFPDGTLQVAGGIVWRDGSADNFGREDDPSRPAYNYLKEVDYIPGASLMIRKKLWDEIGGFDERYVPAYYEDTDLCFEVRERGCRVVYQPRSVVVHFEGRSHGTDLSSGVRQYQILNKKIFSEKWLTQLSGQCIKGDFFHARDRSVNQKQIFVSDIWVPEHDKNAGARCTRLYLELFLSMGLKVTFYPRDNQRQEPYATQLEQLGIEVLLNIDIHLWIAENIGYFDYIYLHRPDATILLDELLLFKSNHAKLCYFAHDLHHVRLRRQYEIDKDPELLAQAEDVEKSERAMFENSDIIHVVGNFEASLLSQQYPGKPVRNIPLFFFDDDTLIENSNSKIDDRHGLLFVGSFNHKPNADAVHWIMREVWPAVSTSLPDIDLYIAGSDPPEDVKNYGSNRVHVTGYLTDSELQHLYITCRMMVLPLRYGAGVKGKVLEGMRFGIPVMTTPVGAEGIPQAENALIVKQWELGWAKHIIEYYTQATYLNELVEIARTTLCDNFTLSSAKSIICMDIKCNINNQTQQSKHRG